MLFIKYALMFAGFGLLVLAAGILAWDLYAIFRHKEQTPKPIRWRPARKLAVVALAPLLVGLSIANRAQWPGGRAAQSILGSAARNAVPGFPSGSARGGNHFSYSMRETRFFSTTLETTKKNEALRVQTQEGLSASLAVAVRYRLDARKLPYIYANLPQTRGRRNCESRRCQRVPGKLHRIYLVREIFSTKREQLRREAAAQITVEAGLRWIVVKEVVLRDIQLPGRIARGLEGLLLKEQENDGMNIELELKQKRVRSAELEAEAEKAREVKAAEGHAAVIVIQAKAQADAMQHTLPLKEKQIQPIAPPKPKRAKKPP